MNRAPGLSVRLKLTLSYAGFLLVAGALLLGATWVYLTRVTHVGLILEPGYEPEVSIVLAEAGYEVRAWPSLHHYFGGVSLVGRAGSAGDPRRGGGAQALAPG